MRNREEWHAARYPDFVAEHIHLDEVNGLCCYKFTSKVNLKRGDCLDIKYKNRKIEKVCTFEKTGDTIQIANILEIVDDH